MDKNSMRTIILVPVEFFLLILFFALSVVIAAGGLLFALLTESAKGLQKRGLTLAKLRLVELLIVNKVLSR